MATKPPTRFRFFNVNSSVTLSELFFPLFLEKSLFLAPSSFFVAMKTRMLPGMEIDSYGNPGNHGPSRHSKELPLLATSRLTFVCVK